MCDFSDLYDRETISELMMFQWANRTIYIEAHIIFGRAQCDQLDRKLCKFVHKNRTITHALLIYIFICICQPNEMRARRGANDNAIFVYARDGGVKSETGARWL